MEPVGRYIFFGENFIFNIVSDSLSPTSQRHERPGLASYRRSPTTYVPFPNFNHQITHFRHSIFFLALLALSTDGVDPNRGPNRGVNAMYVVIAAFFQSPTHKSFLLGTYLFFVL